MKGGRNFVADHPGCVGNLAHTFNAVAVRNWSYDSVVGQIEILAFLGLHDDGFARGAYSGIDNNQENGAGRIIRRYAGQKSRSFFDGERSDLVRDVHDANIRDDTENHGFTNGDGVVSSAEIGHENYRGARYGSVRCRLLLMRADRKPKSDGEQQYCGYVKWRPKKSHSASSLIQPLLSQ